MKTDIRTCVSIMLTLGCLVVGTARADTPIYKWVDDQGQVHYSTVPHGDKSQPLAIQNTSAPNAGTGVTPAPGAASGGSAADAQLVQPQPNDSPACKAGRDRLFKYLHADKLYSTDSNGNKTTLSDADKQKALDEARAYVNQACSGGGA